MTVINLSTDKIVKIQDSIVNIFNNYYPDLDITYNGARIEPNVVISKFQFDNLTIQQLIADGYLGSISNEIVY